MVICPLLKYTQNRTYCLKYITNIFYIQIFIELIQVLNCIFYFLLTQDFVFFLNIKKSCNTKYIKNITNYIN